MEMNIINKMELAKQEYGELQQQQEAKRQELQDIINEQLRIEGKFRTLVQLGMETGVLDAQGNPLVDDGIIEEGELVGGEKK